MKMMPLAYCENCNKDVPFYLSQYKRRTRVRGIPISYDHTVAVCTECREEVYSPAVNDMNVEARELAYMEASRYEM